MTQLSLAINIANSLTLHNGKYRQRDILYYGQYNVDVHTILDAFPSISQKSLEEYNLDDWNKIESFVEQLHECLLREDATINIVEVYFDEKRDNRNTNMMNTNQLQQSILRKYQNGKVNPTRARSKYFTSRFRKLHQYIQLQMAIIPLRNAIRILDEERSQANNNVEWKDGDDDGDDAATMLNEDDLKTFWYVYNCFVVFFFQCALLCLMPFYLFSY